MKVLKESQIDVRWNVRKEARKMPDGMSARMPDRRCDRMPY